MAFIEELLKSWVDILKAIGPYISVILISLGGIMYGLAQTQPAESRGKWQTWGMGLIIGGIIVAAIVAGAWFIQENASKLLTFVLLNAVC